MVRIPYLLHGVTWWMACLFVMTFVFTSNPIPLSLAINVRNEAFEPFTTQQHTEKKVQIQQWQWKDNQTILDPYVAQIQLPPSLIPTMRQFCEDMGITDVFRHLFANPENELPLDSHLDLDLQSKNNDDQDQHHYSFHLQRRPSSENRNSNMHWLNANNEATHDLCMDQLFQGGFAEVLDALGSFYGLEGIDCYSIGFIGVTHFEETGFLHRTRLDHVEGNTFRLLIPLYLVEGSGPEFLVQYSKGQEGAVAKLYYDYDIAIAVGGHVGHGMGQCDYRRDQPGQFCMAMSINLGDIHEKNVHNIIKELTDPFPPAGADYLLQHRGRHWKSQQGLQNSPSLSAKYLYPDVDWLLSKSSMKEARIQLMEKYRSDLDDYYENYDEEDEDYYEEDHDKEDEYFDPDDPYAFYRRKHVEAGHIYAYTRPFDPLTFDREDFWDYAMCDDVMAVERPIPTSETWALLRSAVAAITQNDEHSHAPPPDDGLGDGFKVPVEVRQTEDGRGRGVFATQFIPRGTWVWTATYKALLADAALYRQLMLSLPQELACEVSQFVYIHPLDKDPYKITLEMDNGSLVNGGEPGAVNLECVEEEHGELAPGGCKNNFFACRDIRPGEELLIDDNIYNEEAWEAIGLHDPLARSEHDQDNDYLLRRPFDPLTFDRTEFWDYAMCDDVMAMERPIPTTETWALLRSAVAAIAQNDDQSYAPPPDDGSGDGFQVPVEAGQTEDRGRGIFATEFIPRGSWVWTAAYQALLADAALYRQLMLALPPDMACEVAGFVYIHPSDNDPYKITVEMDIGALVNGGEPGEVNLECIHHEHGKLVTGGCKKNFFAMRDIQPGEELLINYGMYDHYAWAAMGLYNAE